VLIDAAPLLLSSLAGIYFSAGSMRVAEQRPGAAVHL
jgi:hypothetical protein